MLLHAYCVLGTGGLVDFPVFLENSELARNKKMSYDCSSKGTGFKVRIISKEDIRKAKKKILHYPFIIL